MILILLFMSQLKMYPYFSYIW